MKIIAYIRISTDKQDLDNQKLSILNYARNNNFRIDDFIEIKMSSKKSDKERKIDELLKELNQGDTLIVCELSRLGRSLGQIIKIVDELIKNKNKFIAIKENIVFNSKQDIRTKVMITMFGLFAEIERDLISQRTKEALAVAKSKGKLLGRPKGALSKSKLDGKEEEIKVLLKKKVSITSIGKIFEVSRPALYSFIKSRKLQ